MVPYQMFLPGLVYSQINGISSQVNSQLWYIVRIIRYQTSYKHPMYLRNISYPVFQTLHNHEYMIKQCYGKAHKQAEEAVLGLDQ